MRLPIRGYQTILSRILQLLFVFIILPLVLILVLYTVNTQRAVREEIHSTNMEALITESTSIERMIDAMLSSSNLISLDAGIHDMIKKSRDSENSRFEQYRVYQEITRNLTDVKNYILPGDGEITLIDSLGTVYSTASLANSIEFSEIVHMDWYKRTIDSNGYIYWFASPRDAVFGYKDVAYFSMARLMKFDYGDEEVVLLVHVKNEEYLSKRHAGRQDGTIFSLVNEQGTIFMSSQIEEVGKTITEDWIKELPRTQDLSITYNGMNKNVLGYRLPSFNWKLVMMYDPKVIQENLAQSRNTLILMVGCMSLIFVLLIYSFSKFITRPLRMLSQSIQQIDSGNLDSRVPIAGPIEVKVLTMHFNLMIRRLNDSIERNKEERRKKEEARYQALQAQINPHFLFNTLNTIKWSAYMSEAPHVAEMISKLGRLLEVSFKNANELVSLQDELEYVKLYIDIQNTRFNNNYQLNIAVDESILDTKVPKLCLQPIVENAILHGFKNGSIAGEITIAGRIIPEGVELQISDNGIGMGKELHQVPVHQLYEDTTLSFGIGLRNVTDRIHIQFGVKYGLFVSCPKSGGMKITMIVPRQEDDKC